MAIDWATIKATIQACVAEVTGLSENSVVWLQEGAPYHGAAEIDLIIDRLESIGRDEIRYDLDEDGNAIPNHCGQRTFNLNVRASTISHEAASFALHYVGLLHTRLQRDNIVTALNTINVSLNEFGPCLNGSLRDGDREWPMYGFTIACGTVDNDVDTVYDGATIESFDVHGTIEWAADGSEIEIDFTVEEPEE